VQVVVLVIFVRDRPASPEAPLHGHLPVRPAALQAHARRVVVHFARRDGDFSGTRAQKQVKLYGIQMSGAGVTCATQRVTTRAVETAASTATASRGVDSAELPEKRAAA
jgi:hypothetical protein